MSATARARYGELKRREMVVEKRKALDLVVKVVIVLGIPLGQRLTQSRPCGSVFCTDRTEFTHPCHRLDHHTSQGIAHIVSKGLVDRV